MSIKPPTQKELRVALLLNWRNKGYGRPLYGLIDDEELLRTGASTFLCADGRQLRATPNDLLLLQDASAGVVSTSVPMTSAITTEEARRVNRRTI